MPHTDIEHQVDVRSKLKLESKTDYPFSRDGKDVKGFMETYVFYREPSVSTRKPMHLPHFIAAYKRHSA